ncbi:MAG TPA: sterol desaturase family protein, partial [Bacteroidia bacterium]
LAAVTLNYKKWKHALTNSFFIFTAAPVQFLLGVALTKTISWEELHHVGLFYWIPALSNDWIKLIGAFVALDFFEYVYHVIMHKVKTLWMFHAVHHSDRVVDVSCTLREHPGETFVRLSFSVLWIFILGAPFWVVVIHQFFQILANVFAHSNFRLPEKINRVVSLLFVTPNFHHVHHHYKQPYTNCNYGDILSIWDRLLGSFAELETSKTVFGIDTVMDPKENANFLKLIKLPFGKYRSPENE